MLNTNIFNKWKKIGCIVAIILLLLTNLRLAYQEWPQIQAEGEPQPSSRYFIYVNADGFEGGRTFVGCQIYLTSAQSYPPRASVFDDSQCNLGEAINLVNTLNPIFYLDDEISIRIAENLPTISLTQDLPAITFPGNLTLDGIHDTAPNKTTIRDSSPAADQLNYVFLLQPDVSSLHLQFITIKNFGFVSLKKDSAYAITTDDPKTTSVFTPGNETIPNFEGSFIENVIITDNYFGTTDGITLSNANYLQAGIGLVLYPTSAAFSPGVEIQQNNFFNTNHPIFITTGTAAGPLGFPEAAACNESMLETRVNIRDNTIGISKSNTFGSSELFSNSGWSDKAIAVCRLAGVNVAENRIVNSNKNTLFILFNTAISFSHSAGTIKDNSIGSLENLSSSTNNQARIIGNGILLYRNYDDSHRTYITGNRIYNLARPDLAAACELVASRYSPSSFQSTVCGGTGIMIEQSSNNWIYNNRIGSKDKPNQGYGISIEGTTNADTNDYRVSYRNKISGNSISYNEADGIHINSATPLITPADPSPCTFTTGTKGNNCENSVSNNKIFRNGTQSSSSNGGIGIDIKTNDEHEQKPSTTGVATLRGTSNDTDITLIQTNGLDVIEGGNNLLLAPTLSATLSTGNEIRGTLPMNIPSGKYWVEVFQVLCPADSTSSEDTNSLATASRNCDVDSPSDAERDRDHTYGQGANFLCGVVVEKNPVAEPSWSCSPESFGQERGRKLLTANVSEILPPAVASRRSYSTLSDDLARLGITVPISTASFNLPNIRYSCDLVNLLLTNIAPCSSQTGTSGANIQPLGNIYAANFLGNTSEFSQNIFIESANVSMTKTVATCTNITVASCTNNFATTGEANRNGYLDFRITITNNNTTAPILAQFYDPMPAGLSIIPNSCVYQKNINITATIPARSALTATPCTFTNSQIDISGISQGQSVVLYFMAHISSLANDSIRNTAYLNVDGFEADTQHADITILETPPVPPSTPATPPSTPPAPPSDAPSSPVSPPTTPSSSTPGNPPTDTPSPTPRPTAPPSPTNSSSPSPTSPPTPSSSPSPSSSSSPTSSPSASTPSISITKRADNNVTTSDHSNEKVYKPNDSVNYTISLLNNGSVPANNLIINDHLPSILTNLGSDSLASNITTSLTDNILTFNSINVSTGTTPITLSYHGKVMAANRLDLDEFDLDTNKQNDFYLAENSDILEEDISTSGNRYSRTKNILGIPDGKLVSFSEAGSITIDLGTKVLINASGDDFALLELDAFTDDTDSAYEEVEVEVSQDNINFEKVSATDSNSFSFDLSDADLPWARYIKITDQTLISSGQAPGVDIDAICLAHIGIQVANQAMIASSQAFASATITVDVTKAFSDVPSLDECTESKAAQSAVASSTPSTNTTATRQSQARSTATTVSPINPSSTITTSQQPNTKTNPVSSISQIQATIQPPTSLAKTGSLLLSSLLLAGILNIVFGRKRR